jgi:uncharacterized protein (TIGR02453 family)
MPAESPIFTRETFRFFRDLARNNRTDWMEENRERYKRCVVRPFRDLCDALAPAMLRLDARFDVTGRSGANFSRINRDTRFAKDKTPYRAQMYLKFGVPFGDGEAGQLYTGVFADTVTAGFRIYSGSKRKLSALGLIAEPRVNENPRWPSQQKKRLARKYESYWYSTQKGEWTKRSGWPASPEEWKKLQGWVVRRKLGVAPALRSSFSRDLIKTFRELYPLLQFTSLRD